MTPTSFADEPIKSPQQTGNQCQIDNCPGPAEIWIAIKGDLIYSDDARDLHFNVWVCRAHYEDLASVPPELVEAPNESE